MLSPMMRQRKLLRRIREAQYAVLQYDRERDTLAVWKW